MTPERPERSLDARARRATVRTLATVQDLLAWRRRPARRARRPEITDPPGCVVAANRYGVYAVPLSGIRRPAAQRVLAGKVWEERTLSLLMERAADGDIVHAGTYFGDFLPGLASAAEPGGAQVIAFEPNPESFRCAIATVELNHCGNVTIHEAALSDRAAILELATTDVDGRPLGGQAHLTADGGSTVSVQALRIDDAVTTERRVAAIHLDVEGNELAAVQGGWATIERDHPLIVLEAGPSADSARVELERLGYRQTRGLERNLVLSR